MPDQYLRDLLTAPSTSGYEESVQEIVRSFLGPIADELTTDVHGNVIGIVNSKATPRILLDAHCDQIGLIVKHIDDKGMIRVAAVGGWDMQILLGQRMLVHTAGGPVPGVIARKPIHLLSEDERKTVPKIQEMWIDIGSMSESETREIVRIGDSATAEPALRELRNGRISGVAMDDRTGVWVVTRAFEKIAKASPKACVGVVSAVQEEIGLRGTRTAAYGFNPAIGIAVDVTHATDCPGIDQNEHGRIRLGGGPVIVRGSNANPRVVDLLLKCAEDEGIDVQINALPRAASNDAAVLQINRAGCATGLVTLPNRYMHSPVEVVALSDLEQSADLIAAFCLAIDDTTDFTP